MKTDFKSLSQRSPAVADALCVIIGDRFSEIPGLGQSDALEIVVTLNGVEVDFENFVKLYADQMDRLVEARAVALVDQRAWDGFRALSDTIEKARELLDRKTRELFPLSCQDED